MKFTRSIETSDLKLFGSLKEAQQHELELILTVEKPFDADLIIPEIAELLLAERERVLDILTTTERSRPSARKINGATRKKRERKPNLTPPPGPE